MLIDDYELTRKIERMKGVNRDDVIALIARQKPVDAEPVKHGRWVRNDNGTYSCSECHSWIPNEQHYYARYCLFCGAKMDVEEQDETD